MTQDGAYVVFDTETTGLPTRRRGKVNGDNLVDFDSCRMVQIAWEVYANRSETEPVSTGAYLIAPNNFTIPEEATAIHGITNETARANGINVGEVLNLFLVDIKRFGVTTAVAHNIAFDENVLLSEIYRATGSSDEYLEIWNGLTKYCTMLSGSKKGQRWPKLNALYTKLVGPIPESINLHCATDDTKLCSAIYRAQMN